VESGGRRSCIDSEYGRGKKNAYRESADTENLPATEVLYRLSPANTYQQLPRLAVLWSVPHTSHDDLIGVGSELMR
jgi:hypothetical protein